MKSCCTGVRLTSNQFRGGVVIRFRDFASMNKLQRAVIFESFSRPVLIPIFAQQRNPGPDHRTILFIGEPDMRSLSQLVECSYQGISACKIFKTQASGKKPMQCASEC